MVLFSFKMIAFVFYFLLTSAMVILSRLLSACTLNDFRVRPVVSFQSLLIGSSIAGIWWRLGRLNLPCLSCSSGLLRPRQPPGTLWPVFDGRWGSRPGTRGVGPVGLPHTQTHSQVPLFRCNCSFSNGSCTSFIIVFSPLIYMYVTLSSKARRNDTK